MDTPTSTRPPRFRQLGVCTALALPAFAFLFGGIAKLDDPFLAALFIARALRVPLTHAFDVVRAVAVAELLVAAVLCLTLGRTRLPAYAGMCLLSFFVGMLLVIVLSDPNAASCGCFGGLMGKLLQRSLWTQVSIDLALLALLIVYAGLLPRRRDRRPGRMQPADDAGQSASGL